MGVPAASDSGAKVGSLSGSSALSDNKGTIEQASFGQATDKYTQSKDMADDFVAKWLDVKVLSFEEEQPENKEQGEK